MTAVFKHIHPWKWNFIWRVQCQFCHAFVYLNMILSTHRKKADINADWPFLRGSDLIGQEIKQITKYLPRPRRKKKVPKTDDTRYVKWVRTRSLWVSTIYPGNVSHSRHQLCEIYANVYILVKDQLFFLSLHPNIYLLATTVQAINCLQAWKQTERS